MKSIMHEASSIAKAIEQGWEKAGKPTDFSIKILEKPQKNFFGLTTHPAKIALYFDERPHANNARHEARQPKPRTDYHVAPSQQQERPGSRSNAPRHSEQRGEAAPKMQERPRHAERPRIEQRVIEPKVEQKNERAPHAGARLEAQWNEAMIAYAREWLDTVLPESAGKRVGFMIEPNNLYLRITFEGSVLENPEKEKRLFASLSLLILEALKRKFKAGLRKHKIILTTGQHAVVESESLDD